jgi:pilus assembly protein CpaF
MGDHCCATCELFGDRQAELVKRAPIDGPPASFKVRVMERGGLPYDVIPQKPRLVIGRVAGNDITLPEGSVSKRASAITFRDDGVFVEDLKSSCGTYVDGRKITSPTRLGEGAKIYIGDFVLEVVRL